MMGDRKSNYFYPFKPQYFLKQIPLNFIDLHL